MPHPVFQTLEKFQVLQTLIFFQDGELEKNLGLQNLKKF